MGGTQVGTRWVKQQAAGVTSLDVVQHYDKIHTLFLHAGVSLNPLSLSRLPLQDTSGREKETPEF